MKKEFINQKNGQVIVVEMKVRLDTSGDKIYKFTIAFPDGRTSHTVNIFRVGGKYTNFPCFLHSEYATTTPDFYMYISPYNLFTEQDGCIETISLETKDHKRKEVYLRVE
jgi:hypothetical protein